MNEQELLHDLYELNETELFYREYQENKKDPDTFSGIGWTVLTLRNVLRSI